MKNTEENSAKIGNIQKKKKNQLNTEKISKIWKKCQLKSEMIYKLWKKGRWNSGKVLKIWNTSKLNSEKINETKKHKRQR